MNNAVKIIAALSLLLGLSLGQIHYQHQELESLTGRKHHFVPHSIFDQPTVNGRQEMSKAEVEVRRNIQKSRRTCAHQSRHLELNHSQVNVTSPRHRLLVEE